MRLATFNVRNPNFDDGHYSWGHRREAFYLALREMDADVLCLQESVDWLLTEVQEGLNYKLMIGDSREANDPKGERCAILFRESPKIREQGQFWLSETPTVPGSKDWDAFCPRVCTWAVIDSKEPWLLMNTHLDNISEVARNKGIAMIIAHANKMALPTVLAADLNAHPDSPCLHTVYEAGFSDAAEGLGPTFHGWGSTEVRLDYLMTRGVDTNAAAIHTAQAFASDHWPIVADLRVTL